MSCTQTGVFATINACADSPVGETYGYVLSLAQSGEQMTALADYGQPWVFPSTAAAIREDGSSAFTPSMSVTESGVTLSLDAAFTINSPRVGELTGTVNEVWRVPNFSGEARLTQEIVTTTRISTAAQSSISEDSARRLRLLRRIGAQKR
jgi:hypothetical protein